MIASLRRVCTADTTDDGGDAMTEHQVGTQERCQAARRELLELEPFYYQLLDLVPSGRGIEGRVTRHDEYDGAFVGAG
jgi:predicted dithiol-disulfide oxidoreductase (DUF899 family)